MINEGATYPINKQPSDLFASRYRLETFRNNESIRANPAGAKMARMNSHPQPIKTIKQKLLRMKSSFIGFQVVKDQIDPIGIGEKCVIATDREPVIHTTKPLPIGDSD